MSKVRYIETIESSITGSYSVSMISPSSCTTISRFRAGALQSFTVTYSYYFKVH